jgi:hypothetical protein
MSEMSLSDIVAQLMATGADPRDIIKVLKKASSSTEQATADMAVLASKYPSMNLREFKKAAASGHKRAHPDDVKEVKEVQPGTYRAFVQEMMPDVVAKNPKLARGQHLTMIASMWKVKKTINKKRTIKK